MPIIWILVTFLSLSWIVVSISFEFNFMLMSIPTFFLLSAINIYTGIIFIRAKNESRNERIITGSSFILWGIHKADYPFLRPITSFAPWGYIIGAFLEFSVAIGVVLLHFQRSKAQLKASNEKMRLAADSAHFGIWELDVKENRLEWDDWMFRLYGISRNDFSGVYGAWQAGVHPDDLERSSREVQQALRGEKEFDTEFRIIRPDGKVRNMKAHATVSYDSKGDPIRMVGINYDTTDRIQADNALRESEEKFRDLSSMLPQIVFETDSKLNLTFVNENAFSTFLYTKEDFDSGLNALQMISPSDQNRAAEVINRILKGDDEGIGNEYLAVKKDGTEFPVIIYSSRILRKGAPAGIRGVMVDISDRKMAEEKLRESEEKFRLTFDASPDSININRLQDGLYVDINRGFTELTGYTREDVIGKTSMEINIWDDIDDRKKLVAALKSSGLCENLQAQFRRKDGSVTTALMSARVVHLQGEPHIISITRDISERIKADNVTRENELKFRTLYELSPQAIALTKIATGELLDVNDKLCELTQYSREEIIGKTTTDVGFYSEKDRQTFMSELMRSGQVNGLEMEFFAKDGSILTALMFARPVKIMGEPLLLTIFHNITEQKNLEKNIAQAQRMEAIGNLAGGIAHDFNNLLFPIIGMAELLTEDLDPGSVQYENVQEILKAGMRGSDLVKQILAFSRQSRHKIIPVRVQQVLRDVVKLSRATIPTNIEISEDIQKDCGLVLADPGQIHQIGMNLITNAYHAVEETGGSISVSLKEKIVADDENPSDSFVTGRYAVLSFTDNGSGIPTHAMDKIFDPYFTTKERGKGTGLGLSVVYGIVKEHHGDITVTSELGKGTTFNVYLPIMAQAEKSVPVEKKEDDPKGHEQILLVDDEETIAKLEKQMLERLGYRVIMCVNSLEALQIFKIKSESFDLVISDMTMPNMTGDQLAREMIAIRPDIPIIICTGFSERINQEKAELIGVKGFLMKPIVKAEIAKTVRKVLDEAKG